MTYQYIYNSICYVNLNMYEAHLVRILIRLSLYKLEVLDNQHFGVLETKY